LILQTYDADVLNLSAIPPDFRRYRSTLHEKSQASLISTGLYFCNKWFPPLPSCTPLCKTIFVSTRKAFMVHRYNYWRSSAVCNEHTFLTAIIHLRNNQAKESFFNTFCAYPTSCSVWWFTLRRAAINQQSGQKTTFNPVWYKPRGPRSFFYTRNLWTLQKSRNI